MTNPFKYLIGTFGILLFFGACKSDEAPKLVQYTLGPYEIGEENLFVSDTVIGLHRVELTPEFAGHGLTFKAQQFPEYLEEGVFRSFAFVNEKEIELTIKPRNKEILEKSRVQLNEDGTLSDLPDFHYNETEDFFYQCFGIYRTKGGKGGNLNIIYGSMPFTCGDMDAERLAKEKQGSVGHTDTILVSFVYLPFRKE